MVKWTARYTKVDPHKITHRLAFNPSYPGIATGVPGAVGVRIRRNVKPKTRARILDSIEKEGFRNPIIVYRTTAGMFLGFGGGRLLAAQKLDALIPAIVIDYIGGMEDDDIVTPSNWEKFFLDVPAYFQFTSVGISTHYGLERAREEPTDPAGLAWAQDDDMPDILDESPWLSDERKS